MFIAFASLWVGAPEERNVPSDASDYMSLLTERPNQRGLGL